VPNGISGVALDLLDALLADAGDGSELTPEYWVATAVARARRSYQQVACPHLLARLLGPFGCDSSFLRQRITNRFVRTSKPGDVAWLFPSVERDVYQQVKQRGGLVVKELANTALDAHRDALVRAHQTLGWEPTGLPPQCDVDEEREQLPFVDRFFACSPEVARTFVTAGADERRIVPTSYGWSPTTFQPVPQRSERPRFLFVGTGSVRKGLPHLLRVWAQARLDATLVVVADLDPLVVERCQAELSLPNVELHGFTADLASVYGRADAFVLPSFEEGSPLVSYFAMAAGLPCLMTPASAGIIVRDGIEGLVVDPASPEAMLQALHRLADDAELRASMGEAGRRRSAEFTWEHVMRQRCTALRQLIETGGELPVTNVEAAV